MAFKISQNNANPQQSSQPYIIFQTTLHLASGPFFKDLQPEELQWEKEK